MAYNKMQKYFDMDTVLTLKVANAIVASATTTTGTPYIEMGRSHYITFILMAIDANLAGSITVKVLEATATGAGLKTATPLKSTTFSTGTADAGTIKILEVAGEELDVANGYDHVTLQVVTAGADSFACAAIRGPNRYDPASLI